MALNSLFCADVPLSNYSLTLQLSPVLWTIKQHARVCTRRAGDGSFERPLIIVCNAIRQQLMNLHWCTYIGSYNSNWYDLIRYTQYRFQYDTDPIIVCSQLEISRRVIMYSKFLIKHFGELTSLRVDQSVNWLTANWFVCNSYSYCMKGGGGHREWRKQCWWWQIGLCVDFRQSVFVPHLSASVMHFCSLQSQMSMGNG